MGSKYEVYVRSPAPSHMQTFNNPFEPLQQRQGGEYFSKEVFMRRFFLRPLFLRLSLLLSRYDTANDYTTIAHNRNQIKILNIQNT